jgi:hypothetical protein
MSKTVPTYSLMKHLILFLLFTASLHAQQTFDATSAERFAKLALACVHKEYPNKISHTMNSDADVAPPRKLTPAFYGCYDWHSSVHGHWLLARLARTNQHAEFAVLARSALMWSLTKENIAAEVKYLKAEGRASFERPYGLAWLLQLAAELREWGEPKPTTEARRHGERQSREEAKAKAKAEPTTEAQRHGEKQSGEGAKTDPTSTAKVFVYKGPWSGGNVPLIPPLDARELAEILRPLELAAVERLKAWLPKLSHPVRSGEHSQTAFALGLMLDYARGAGDKEFEALLVAKARAFYMKDVNCPLNYEPSGEDFLSPCLAEADVMRRVLPRAEYRKWLLAFLPVLDAKPGAAADGWLRPAVVTDPSDPKLAHLDGLNLSRAWMLEGIAEAIKPPVTSSHIPDELWLLEAAAKAHRTAGLASVTGAHYEGGHWLGSFAAYLVTQRGITSVRPPSP